MNLDTSEPLYGINVLVLDGGPLEQAIPQLQILQVLMERTMEEMRREKPLNPTDLFLMIVGAGIGGVNAILIGRLKLSISQAIDIWQALFQEVFVEQNKTDGRYNATKFRQSLISLLNRSFGNGDHKLKCKRDRGCRTAICAVDSDNSMHPRVFRSYQTEKFSEANEISILDAAHAALASQGLLTPLDVTENGLQETFRGINHDWMNPSIIALKECELAFGKEQYMASLVSIGTGVGDTFSIQREEVLAERVHDEVSCRFQDADVYFRFNNRLFGSNQSSLAQLMAYIRNYCKDKGVSKRMDDCAKTMERRRGVFDFQEINRPLLPESLPKPFPPVSGAFVHRTKINDLINRAFLSENQDSDGLSSCVLHGVGGSGKSQLAMRWIQQNKHRFWKTFYIDSSTESQIQADLQIAIRSLGRRHKNSTWSDGLTFLASETRHWLIVFDGADNPDINLRKYIPKSSRGSVLVTTRNRALSAIAKNNAIQIKEMDEDEAILLLHRVSALHPRSSEESRRIVRDLGCLALAVAQAGGYLFNTRRLSAYRQIFKKHRAELLRKQIIPDESGYETPIYVTWDLSFSLLTPNAQALVSICAFLHHSMIPQSLFEQAATSGFRGHYRRTALSLSNNFEKIVESLQSIFGDAWDEFIFQELVDELARCSLVETETRLERQASQLLNLHSLVHKWARERLKDAEKTHFSQLAGRLLSSAIPPGDNGEDFLRRRLLLSHTKALPAYIQKRDANDTVGFAKVLDEAGLWEECQTLQEYLVSLSTSQLGINHENTLAFMHNLAITLRDKGLFEKAEPIQRKVLEIEIELFGSKHAATIKSMNQLAHTLWNQNFFDQAEELSTEAVRLSTEVFGAEHLDTLMSKSALALTLQSQGLTNQAETMQREVVQIRKQSLGDDHPDTVASISTLARILYNKGDAQEAAALQKNVVKLQKIVLGPEHPTTLNSMKGLARYFQQCRNYWEAGDVETEILKLYTNLLGQRHRLTLGSMKDLANILKLQKFFKQAADLEAVVTGICKEDLGDHHPETNQARNRLKSIHEAWRLAKASEPTPKARKGRRYLAFKSTRKCASVARPRKRRK